jgi:predicted amidohydrolase YtcJ
MTAAADLVLLNAEIHTLGEPDETYEAAAIRDGEFVRLGATYDIEFLADAETETVDLEGKVVLPGFIDAHTHLTNSGRYLVHANLSEAESAEDAISLLSERAVETDDEYVLGFGYDESTWTEARYLTTADLDRVSSDRPVVAFREDMHVASVNSVALERHRSEMPDGDVQTENGTATGVVVEEAVDPLYEAVEPGREATRDLVEAAQAAANERGVTGIHDMVRQSHAPGIYRDLDAEGELSIRVRLNYWTNHLDSLIDLGERTNHGSEMVQTGAVKSYTDGSFGGRTAKLSEPYTDSDADTETDGDGTGQWVVDPEELREYVARAAEHGFQFTAHAIGDEAVRAVVEAYEDLTDPAESRHRIEHVELADDDLIERIADSGIVASMQPNFLKWADEGGLYEARLGDRRTETNRLPAYLDHDAHLAFGSDCMPLDPLLGVHHAVNAPAESQRLDVTDALRAYTLGAAYAGFDEDRLGTIEAGKRADFVVLEQSPWENSTEIEEIDVAKTAVDGEVVYDSR